MQGETDVRHVTGSRGRMGAGLAGAALLAAIPLLALAGCGGSPGSDDGDASESGRAAPAERAAADAAAGTSGADSGADTHDPVEGGTHTHGGDTHTHGVADTLDAAAPLMSDDDGARVGRVTVLTRGDTLRIRVSLEGAEPETRHSVRIRGGSCSEPGAVLSDLTPVMTGTSGDGSSQTELSPAQTAGHAHGALRVSGPSGSSLGCASVHLAGTHEHDGG